MAKFTDKLSLVKFKGEYFPLEERDYRLMRSRNVSVFRLSESTLNILSNLLLKNVKIEQHPWGKVYPSLLNSFKASLKQFSIESGSLDIHTFKQEENWIMVMTDTSDESTKDANVLHCQQSCNQLSEFMGRYGLRTKIESKSKDGYQLTRLTFVPDENIVPSFYFGCREDYNAPLSFDFNLGKSAKLRFSKRLTLQGEPTFGVSFEDKFGDHYQEAFVRAFPFSHVSAKDCEGAIEFFVNLHARLTVLPKKK